MECHEKLTIVFRVSTFSMAAVSFEFCEFIRVLKNVEDKSKPATQPQRLEEPLSQWSDY